MNSPTQRPLCLAVVGHTNAGKTSLLRALTRRVDFGEVSNRPGTTRHVEAIALRLDGRVAVRFLDTPGLEDSVTLDALLQAQPGASRHDSLRRFLAGPEARSSFEQEAKVLRTLVDEADAGLLVIDTREPVLPKFRAEVDILNRCARPLMPVLNFVRDAASRADAWEQMLREAGLHVQIRFDVVTPFHGSEQRLYRDLGVLLNAWEPHLQQVAQALQQQAEERLEAGARLVASTLIDLAALRRNVPAHAQAAAGQDIAPEDVRKLQETLHAHVQRAAHALLDLYAFRADEADLPDLPALVGRWERDLLHPQVLQQVGLRMGLGAALGAGVGLVADLALAGLSLGAGTALGASLGGGAGGLHSLRAKLKNWVSGLQELSAPDAVLLLVADRLCLLLRLLSRRSHAAQERLQLLEQKAEPASPIEAMPVWVLQLLDLLEKARAHPAWERGQPSWRDDEARQRLMQQVAEALQPQLQPRTALDSSHPGAA